MILNPIPKVLSSIQKHRVQALLMGGQACVLYGAAEFSRDADLAILASPSNLTRLRKALADLRAEVIAVPPFRAEYLRRGHAIHFRCRHPDASRLRIAVMSKLRGVDLFPKLWARRTSIDLPGGLSGNLISLPDLVLAKKTQRDKNWPMIRRLVEANYFQNRDRPITKQIKFWLLELRTPELLIEVAGSNLQLCRRLARSRPLLTLALAGQAPRIAEALFEEERVERGRDRRYWAPLKRELEKLRHGG
ncbi:MAG: hypothetical protein HY717_06170 [Planctomycetes bacterium]|nr:hypothetical protein [Planctomycetota bacterium]